MLAMQEICWPLSSEPIPEHSLHICSAGATSQADPLRIAPMMSPGDLLHSLVAVSHAQLPEQLLSMNIAGYIYVSDVDVVKGLLTYLAPCPGPLPGRYLLAGTVKVLID